VHNCVLDAQSVDTNQLDLYPFTFLVFLNSLFLLLQKNVVFQNLETVSFFKVSKYFHASILQIVLQTYTMLGCIYYCTGNTPFLLSDKAYTGKITLMYFITTLF